MRPRMDQSYLDYWGFHRAPFALTPDPDMLYLSKQHRECLLRLQYAIAGNKGGALLVSENPGDGKTSVLRRLEKDLTASEDESYRIVFIDHPTLTPHQMLWEILRQLGFGEVRGEKIQNLLQLREALLEMYQRGERCIFILDEGQLLADRPELMQEFRVLLNYTIGDTFLLTFIFSGQSELEGAMKRLPEFYQRLPVRYFLHSMDLSDTGRMLDYRIKVAGHTGPSLFSESAVKEIFRYARGIPRIICSVADLCLVVGHSRGVRRINDREVYMAIRDMDRSTQDGYHYYHFLRSAGAATPEEEQEILAAEAELDRREAEAALHRLEDAEARGDGEAVLTRLSAQIEAWTPPEELSEPAAAPSGVTGGETTPVEPEPEPEIEAEAGIEPEPETVAEAEIEPEIEAEPETVEEAEIEPEPETVTGSGPDTVEGPALESAEVAAWAPEDDHEIAGERADEGEADRPPWTWHESGAADMVHCPSCGVAQPAERRSCVQCGGPLYWICPACQYRNPAQRPRCDRCGQSLAQAIGEAEAALRDMVVSTAAAAAWGILPAPDFSLNLSEGEKILAVVKNRPLFGRGVTVRARTEAWGPREHKADIVVTNHRIHVITRELQSRIPYHEIQGVRATRGKVHLFHSGGGARIGYPAGESEIYNLVHALLSFLDFQTRRYRV